MDNCEICGDGVFTGGYAVGLRWGRLRGTYLCMPCINKRLRLFVRCPSCSWGYGNDEPMVAVVALDKHMDGCPLEIERRKKAPDVGVRQEVVRGG